MLSQIRSNLSKSAATLIAVSKTQIVADILPLYEQAQRDFGENKVQELLTKYEQMPKDIRWHFIGHLQSNKVKSIVPFVHLIHSVDSVELLETIDKQAFKVNKKINILLQFHIASEESKFGFEPQQFMDWMGSGAYLDFPNIIFCGVMGMATFTDDQAQVRSEFQQLKAIFDRLRQNYFSNNPDFREISMGMSDDYLVALEEGSTMIRIGSLLFGKRH